MTDTSETTAAAAEQPPANPTVERVRSAFGEAVLDVVEHRGETTLIVDRARVLDLLGFLKSAPDLLYIHLSNVTAVDYLDLEIEPRFCVVYHLYSLEFNRRLRLRAPVPEDDPVIESCVGLFPTANFFEREVYDLFGIRFQNHPNLRRILMPDEWQGWPLRKDTPIGGEEIEFTYNVGRVHGRRSEL